MSKVIQYKDELYDFETLILMQTDKNFKSFINPEDFVTLKDTGEEVKIKDLSNLKYERDRYLIDNTKHLSYNQKNKITKVLNNGMIEINKSQLYQKFNDKTISKEELESLMLLENKNMMIKYVKGFYVNKIKTKPEGLSDDYYGKFFRLLHLMNYGNSIRHDNSLPIKKEEIVKHLGMKTDRAFEIFIKSISSYNMIAKMKRNMKDKILTYLVINPAYATMNIKIDNMIFGLFKEDLTELLSPLEIRYLEMDGEENDNPMLCYE